MKRALLINGVPASGKSTIANTLTPHLTSAGLNPVPFALDTVKEGLFAQIGTGDREYNRMLGRASYHAIFNTIAAFPDRLLAVIDAWHGFQPKDVIKDHLERAEIDQVIEVWVAISPATAAARYIARSQERHSGHLPASYADELFTLAGNAQPMGLDEVITVDGEGTLTNDAIEKIIKQLHR
ncbi:MAG: adenylyl-sulfate kinase [Paracoccaceae bacterium]